MVFSMDQKGAAIHSEFPEQKSLIIGLSLIIVGTIIQFFDLFSLFLKHHGLLVMCSKTIVRLTDTAAKLVFFETPLMIFGTVAAFLVAKNWNFLTTMAIISAASIFFVFIQSFPADAESTNSNMLTNVSVLRSIYVSFFPATFILPGLFYYKITPRKYHHLINISIFMSLTLAGLAASALNSHFIASKYQPLRNYMFTGGLSLLCFCAARFFIVEPGKDSPAKTQYAQNIPSILVLVTLGALLAISVGFPIYFSAPYFIETTGLSLLKDISPLGLFWAFLMMSVIPARFIFNKFGFIRSLYLSALGATLLAAILWYTNDMTATVYTFFRAIFCLSSSMFLYPFFQVVHEIVKRLNAPNFAIFWILLGFLSVLNLRAYILTIHTSVLFLSITMLLISLIILVYLIENKIKKDFGGAKAT